jgi:hypothetical protein
MPSDNEEIADRPNDPTVSQTTILRYFGRKIDVYI